MRSMSLRIICPFLSVSVFSFGQKTIKFARYLVQFLACLHYICSGIRNQFILVVQEGEHFADFFQTITHLDGT